MIDIFQNDFWTMSREQRGYYSWARHKSWILEQHLHKYHRMRCGCREAMEPQQLVDDLFDEGLGLHVALDPVFSAFARAETRLLLRFIPQRSHEERLTGSLVSEIDSALFIANPEFRKVCLARYGESRDVDFIYYDLSRGGKLEKETGADLGIILNIDLPDLPPVVRYAAFQAKKIHRTAQLPKRQYKTFVNKFGDAASYLFYDMDLQTLLPPMVLPARDLKRQYEEKSDTDSFSVSLNKVGDGLPLSLWLFSLLAKEKAGKSMPSFDSALNLFTRQLSNEDYSQSGRLAILSIGRPLNLNRNLETGLEINI